MNSKSTPLISVIIPCFNSEKYIGLTLDRLFKQSMKDFEVIVVDDGSTDKTREILATYKKGIRVIESSHQGASEARSMGVKAASGEIIQFLDSDDWLDDEALEKKYKALVRYDADVVYTGYQRVYEKLDGKLVEGPIFLKKMEDISEDKQLVAFTEFWALHSQLYRKKVIEAVSFFNPKLKIIQDVRLFFDVVRDGVKIVFVPEVLAYYRLSDKQTSLSKGNRVAFLKDIYENSVDVQQLWRGQGELTEKRKKALLGNYAQVARGVFGLDPVLFDKAYTQMQKISPDYIPEGGLFFRRFAKWMGYRRAEALAFQFRELKSHLGHKVNR